MSYVRSSPKSTTYGGPNNYLNQMQNTKFNVETTRLTFWIGWKYWTLGKINSMVDDASLGKIALYLMAAIERKRF